MDPEKLSEDEERPFDGCFDDTADTTELVGALADEERLRLLARIVLAGPEGIGATPAELGGTPKQAGRNVARLLRSGMVRRGRDGRLTADVSVFRRAAEASRRADREAARAAGAPDDVAQLYARGRLTDIPLSEPLRGRVLDHLADRFFRPGGTYTEREVDAALVQVWGDYATLRRDLVDSGRLARSRDGAQYWRNG